jgi:hypothetical protein
VGKFTLKDVTAATWQTLSNPPDGTAVPPEPSALCLADVEACKDAVQDRVNEKSWYARNTDWDPRVLPKITSPISWPFLNRPMLKKSSFAKWEIFDLAFVAAPPAGYKVKVYSVTFSSANVPPQFIGVAYPRDLDISKPPPFLVHYKHVPGQGSSSLFKFFNPLGYDWLRFELWSYFVYNAGRFPNGTMAVDMPFLSSQQFSFGFTYQLRQANKQYVIVLPQISRNFEVNGRLRDYQLYSAATLRNILIAIQKDILPIKDDSLSHVAISSNSNGCNVLSSFLTDNMMVMKQDAAVAEFMKDEFNEVFVFDPPENFADGMVSSLAGWRTLKSSRTPSKGKCVRFYTHTFAKGFENMADNRKNPFTKGTYGFWESANQTTSLAYLPFSRNHDDVWQLTYEEIQPNGTMPVSNFAFVHHVIPALCLTHAALSSVYV